MRGGRGGHISKPLSPVPTLWKVSRLSRPASPRTAPWRRVSGALIRVHDTRHTCGSLLAASDVHPRVAMQILRHSEIAMTMEVYTHVSSTLTPNALKKLGQSLDDLGAQSASCHTLLL
ncbi:site-specific integrase [Actinopolymorpha sp. NPDC004070]|uniref:site-specific integrase n=1 Tax=Actinopolymorpha sp. NPDC004070 TaxID=3154548 RepID=UPI0033BE1957